MHKSVEFADSISFYTEYFYSHVPIFVTNSNHWFFIARNILKPIKTIEVLKHLAENIYSDLEAFTLSSSYILVVEDNEDMREYLGSLLADSHKVLYASNGQEALEVLGKHTVDLVVSDIGMPIMDGFDLLKHLRQALDNLVPFLFLTAHTERAELMQALLLGVDAYLTKPFESEEFLARVNGLLINHQKRKEVYSQAIHPDAGAEDHRDNKEAPVSFRSGWLKELEGIVQKEFGNSNMRVPHLAYKMAVSERTFRNRVNEYTGLSPHEYLMEVRMHKALQLLEKGTYLTVAEVANAVGLEYSSYFTKQFKERFGKAPSEYL